jgi:hypothetical protein
VLVFLIFFNCAAIIITHWAPEKYADFSMPFHQACLTLAPQAVHHASYSAVICGESSRNVTMHSELESSGLLFFLASAGTHLLCVEWLIVRTKHPQRLPWACMAASLVVFTLLSGFNATAVRALASLAFSRLQMLLNLSWTRSQILTAAGSCALWFCNSRGSLLGLALSWTAALAFGLSVRRQQIPVLLRHTWNQLRLYVLLIPPLLPISVPSPATILVVAVFFPWLAISLFLISLGSFFLPSTTLLAEPLWCLVDQLALFLARLIPSGLQPCAIPLWTIVLYVALLTACAWWREVVS